MLSRPISLLAALLSVASFAQDFKAGVAVTDITPQQAMPMWGYGADASVSWVPLGAGEEIMNKALINLYTMQGKPR